MASAFSEVIRGEFFREVVTGFKGELRTLSNI